MTSRRDALTIDAFDPGAGTCRFYIREQRLRNLARLGAWALLEARYTVPEIL